MFLLNSPPPPSTFGCGLSCWWRTLEISDFVQSLFVLLTQRIIFIWVENNVVQLWHQPRLKAEYDLLQNIIQYPNISICISILSKVWKWSDGKFGRGLIQWSRSLLHSHRERRSPIFNIMTIINIWWWWWWWWPRWWWWWSFLSVWKPMMINLWHTLINWYEHFGDYIEPWRWIYKQLLKRG